MTPITQLKTAGLGKKDRSDPHYSFQLKGYCNKTDPLSLKSLFTIAVDVSVSNLRSFMCLSLQVYNEIKLDVDAGHEFISARYWVS